MYFPEILRSVVMTLKTARAFDGKYLPSSPDRNDARWRILFSQVFSGVKLLAVGGFAGPHEIDVHRGRAPYAVSFSNVSVGAVII